jgi:hypothetical protein
VYVELIRRVLNEIINPMWTNQEKVLKASPSVYLARGNVGSPQPVQLIKYVPRPAEVVPPAGVFPPADVGPGGLLGVPQWDPIVSYDWPYPVEAAPAVVPMPPVLGDGLPPVPGAPGGVAGPARPLAPHERDEVSAWFHDRKVQAGATYRYRARVRLFNPLFGRATLTTPEHWSKVSLVGPWSQWTNPVVVEDPCRFYLTRADRVGAGGRTATVELYRTICCMPRKATAVVKIGQPIRAVADLEFPNPADRPLPPAPENRQGPGPLQIKKVKDVRFDSRAYLIDCDPDNRRLDGTPPQYLSDPAAVILTADGNLIEQFVDRNRKDEQYKETVARAKEALELPPGRAVREQKPIEGRLGPDGAMPPIDPWGSGLMPPGLDG